MSDAEHELAYLHIDPQGRGIGFYTQIGGYAGSSTRTELAAAILAISAHGPVHFASDSQAMVKRANYYIELVRYSRPINKPFALISDGDLWGHFYQAVQAQKTDKLIANF